MNTKNDNLLTVGQVAAEFKASVATVRGWILAGRLVPVCRQGQGRSGQMHFARGAVHQLVYGICGVCGQGFKRGTLKAKYCSKSCRQKASRRTV